MTTVAASLLAAGLTALTALTAQAAFAAATPVSTAPVSSTPTRTAHSTSATAPTTAHTTSAGTPTAAHTTAPTASAGTPTASAGTPTVVPQAVQLLLPRMVTPGELERIADEIPHAAGPGAAVIAVDQLSTLQLKSGKADTAGQWRQALNMLRGDTLTVVISHPGPTGTAGTLLYALATVRVVADGAILSRLPGDLATACSSRMCAQLASSDTPVTLGKGASTIGDPVVFSSGGLARGGMPTWLLALLLVAAAGAAWLARGALGGPRRLIGRHPPGPGWGAPGRDDSPTVPRAPGAGGVRRGDAPRVPVRPPPQVRDDRPGATARRPAWTPVPGSGIVRTVLGPEGYVEMDGLLFRVTWQGALPAPRRGEVVAVARGGDGELVAHGDPAHSGRA
jgi:hypothetical protein